VSFGVKMLKKMQNNFVAAAFGLLRLLLAATIWSCHAWVAPAVRLYQGSAAVISGSSRYYIDRSRMAKIISQAKACLHLSLRGVNQRGNLKKNDAAMPTGLVITCRQSNCTSTNYSELLDSGPRVALIKSIPGIWGHGVKQPMGQGETPNSELRIPNFKGFTLIEVIAVLIVIGILAATVLPRIDFGTTSSVASVEGAAYMIASDIRYTQECAMANRVSKTISFTATQSSYTFPPTVPSTSGLDPSGQLASLKNVTILTTIDFTFNSLGEPTAGGGNLVRVWDGVNTRTITVTLYTGKVDIS